MLVPRRGWPDFWNATTTKEWVALNLGKEMSRSMAWLNWKYAFRQGVHEGWSWRNSEVIRDCRLSAGWVAKQVLMKVLEVLRAEKGRKSRILPV